MERYLLLEVSEGGQESSFINGEAGFVWVVGPLPKEVRKIPPYKIKEIQEFMSGVHNLNAKLWLTPRRNAEPLRVIISSIEGDVDDATPLDEMEEASKNLLPQIELYYRGPIGEIC